MKLSSIIYLLILSNSILAQNTIGVLKFDSEASESYNFFYPFGQSTIYLIDNCGRIINKWVDESNYGPGTASYLKNDGSVIVSKTVSLNPNQKDTISAPGGGGLIEWRTWDNKVLWKKILNNGKARFHHDIAAMPNGNILAIAWENFSPAESIENGRKPELVTEGAIWPDFLIEYDPIMDEIVWEWHAWDHLIQDFDVTKKNYGNVEDHPELIDINHISASGQADWMHANAIDYNPELQLIALSVAHFNEIWFIDRSTSINEAKGHTGGRYGKGGDLVYRWGNPAAYKKGSIEDQRCFFQHDVKWITAGKYKGMVSFFNNRVSATHSEGAIFNPVLNLENNQFLKNSNGTYLPLTYNKVFLHPEKDNFRSSGTSSFRILDNDRYFLFAGNLGYGFEMDENGKIFWEYQLPFKDGVILSQGQTTTGNLCFKMEKYPKTHPAFDNKVLIPGDYIEKNPSNNLCLLSIQDEPNDKSSVYYFNQSIFTNLVNVNFQIFNINFQKVMEGEINHEINVESLDSGLYIFKAGNVTLKFLK
jgi:hypothetical protein